VNRRKASPHRRADGGLSAKVPNYNSVNRLKNQLHGIISRWGEITETRSNLNPANSEAGVPRKSWSRLVGLRGKQDGFPLVSLRTMVGRGRSTAPFNGRGRKKPDSHDGETQEAHGFHTSPGGGPAHSHSWNWHRRAPETALSAGKSFRALTDVNGRLFEAQYFRLHPLGVFHVQY
jgi:hypothetical protein